MWPSCLQLMAACGDNSVRVWDTHTGAQLHELRTHTQARPPAAWAHAVEWQRGCVRMQRARIQQELKG